MQDDNGTTVDIGIPELALFLRKSGWKRTVHPNDRLLVFEGSSDDFSRPIKIVLPVKDDYVDCERMVEQAIAVMAQVQETSTTELVRLIHSLDRDVFSIRLLGPQNVSGGLPLDVASSFVHTLRDLLAYAACVEDNPRPYFYKASAIGRKYAEKCTFGHTFSGSFGFTVESPTGIGPFVADSTTSSTPPPFERRVLVRVLRGIRQVREAVLSGQPDLLVEQYKSGFNANLCELLAESFEQIEDTEVEYSVGWSPEWAAPLDVKGHPIRLEKKSSQFLFAAAKELRKLKESQLIKMVGKVVALRWEADFDSEDDADEIPQIATILWEEAGRKLRVQVELDSEDYRRACDAHKQSLTVQVTGTLEKVGKFWKLMAPSGFEIPS
jgi:hypothetical protein